MGECCSMMQQSNQMNYNQLLLLSASITAEANRNNELFASTPVAMSIMLLYFILRYVPLSLRIGRQYSNPMSEQI